MPTQSTLIPTSDADPATDASGTQLYAKAGGIYTKSPAGIVAAVGGGGGIFAQTLGTPPTQVSTGLAAWWNQPASATVVDDTNGMRVFCPNQSSVDNKAFRYSVAPAAPYTVTCLIAALHGLGTNAAVNIGFSDGTTSANKLEILFYKPYFGTSDSFGIARFNTMTGFASYAANNTIPIQMAALLWYRMVVTSTTVTYQFSPTGDPNMWITHYTVTKAGSHLGSSGYTNIVFGASGYNSDAMGQLLSWSIT